MAVYFMNNDQRVIKVVGYEALREVTQTQELPEDDSLLKDMLTVSAMNDERLDDAQYMAVESYTGNKQSFDMYRIVNQRTEQNWTTFDGVQLAYYELDGSVVEDIRPENAYINEFVPRLLKGTDWSLGYVDDNLPRVSTHIYYLSVKDALAKVQSVTGVEMIFKVEISGNQVTDKWVEVYERLGDKTLKRFNYGTNALTVVRETSHQDLYTALIGRGKGEEVSSAEDNESGQAGYGRKITFRDVEWSKSEGKPLDKPKDQLFLEQPEATKAYGIQALNGEKLPRVGIVEYSDTEDPDVLIQQTYEALEYYARPKVLFKASVVNIGATGIGDTVTIHRYDLNIHYQIRVRKVIRNKINDNRTQVELGDVVHTSSTKKQANINSALNNLDDTIRDTARNEILPSLPSANGVNQNFYQNEEPERKRTGDLWYRDHPSLAGHRQLLMWNGEAWELLADTSDKEQVNRRVDEIEGTVEEVNEKAQGTIDNINQVVTDNGFTTLEGLFASKMSGEEAETMFYQEAEAIGLVYMEDGIQKAIIGIEEGLPYIRGEHVILDGNTIVDGTFEVTESMLAPEAVIGQLQATGIDAGQINVIGLNMDHIAGGSIELTKGFKITNNGQDVLSIDQNGQTVFNAPNVATKEDLKTIELTPGPPGQDGEDGLPGKDGRDSYTHIAYATGTEGQSFSQSTFEQATHIGMYVSNNQASSTNWRDYEWTLIKGKDGKDGSDGVSVSSTIMQFYQSTSSTELEGGVWSDTPPNWKDGQYIWTRVATNYSNGQTSVSDPVNATGQTGSTGQSGRSVSNVSGQYYLSSSKEQRTGGAWVNSPPIWKQGFYVWTRLKIDYSNPSGTEYTDPTVDSSWEAIDELVYENRNLALGTSNEFVEVTVAGYSGNLVRAGATSKFSYTLEELDVKPGDTMTVSMYVGESVEGYGTGFRIDDQSGAPTYGSGEVVKNGYISETFTILAKSTEIRLYTTGVRISGATDSFKIPIKQLKLEKGPKATPYSIAPEDIQGQIDSKADQGSLDEVSTELSDFQTVVASREEVGEITSALYDYVDDLSRNERDLESAKEDINRLLTRLPIIENNLGTWVEKWSFLDTYVTLGDEGLMISEMNGSTGIRVSKDRIDFMDGSGEPVAYITNQVMRINRAIFVDSIQVGEHKVETIAGGHTIWQWMGG